MAIQTINIGNVVNDGLGDDLRTAFEKVNANFTELEGSLTVTASNVGTTGTGIFKQKTGANLEFKNLISGSKILLEDLGDSIKVNSTAADAFVRIDTNSGSVLANTFTQITVQGGDNVDVTALGSVITVDTVLPVSNILSNFDFGPIDAEYDNSVQLALSLSNLDFGTITLPGRQDLDLGTIV